jgi:hypothetical protein
MFLMVLCEEVNAATLTWVWDQVSDKKASIGSNWSGDVAPVDGDSVIFNGTSSDDCTWDLTVTLVSFTTTSEYTGEITQRSDKILTIAKFFIWTYGAEDNDHLASNKDNWSRGEVPQIGDVVIFNDTSLDDCTWDIDATPFKFNMSSSYTGTVTVTEANGLVIPGNLQVDSGTLKLLSKNLVVGGDLQVDGGTLNHSLKDLDVDGDLSIGANGTISATGSEIYVAGDWKNEGTFNAGESRVFLDGANQTIYGDTTFHYLEKTVDYADTLKFEAGSVQTITFGIHLEGASEQNPLNLRSTEDSQPYYYYICAPKNENNYIINYDVQYMRFNHDDKCYPYNSEIIALYGVSSGGNYGIDFIEEGQGGTCQP